MDEMLQYRLLMAAVENGRTDGDGPDDEGGEDGNGE